MGRHWSWTVEDGLTCIGFGSEQTGPGRSGFSSGYALVTYGAAAQKRLTAFGAFLRSRRADVTSSPRNHPLRLGPVCSEPKPSTVLVSQPTTDLAQHASNRLSEG